MIHFESNKIHERDSCCVLILCVVLIYCFILHDPCVVLMCCVYFGLYISAHTEIQNKCIPYRFMDSSLFLYGN